MKNIRRLTALALAMMLLLALPVGLAEEEDYEVYDEEKDYSEEEIPADMLTDDPPSLTTTTPPPVMNTPPPVLQVGTPEGEESPEESLPPAVIVGEEGAEPGATAAPTPIPTLPVTADKDMPTPNKEAKAEAIVTAAEGTAMFELPSTESSIKAQLSSGAVLTVKALGLSWTKVDNAGQEGYVPTTALSFGYGSPQPGMAIVVAPGGKLTLREKMTTKSKSLGSVSSGRAVVLLAKGKTFSLVRHEAKEGFVLTTHLEEKTADSQLGTLTQVIPAEGKTTANVRLRAKADRKAPFYTSIKSGSSVVIKDSDNGWANIEYEGYHGYMMTDYLKPWQ